MTPVTVTSSARVAGGTGITGWSGRCAVAPVNAIGVVGSTSSYLGIGNSGTAIAGAQSLTPLATADLLALTVYPQKIGSPADTMYLELCANSSSLPGSVIATSDAIAGGSVPASPAFLTFTFSTPPTLTAATKYWFVARRSGGVDGSNAYFCYNTTIGYAGHGQSAHNGTSWSAEDGSADLIFVATFDDQQRGYYVVTQDSGGSPKQRVWESTDDGATWTERDSANAPSSTNGAYPHSINTRKISAVTGSPATLMPIVAGRFTNTNTLRAREFDPIANTWASADLQSADATTGADNLSNIRVGATQDHTILHYTASADDADLSRATRTTGAWSTAADLAATSAERSIYADVVVDAVFNQHRFQYDVANDDFSLRALEGGFNGTLVDVDASAATSETGHAPAVYEPWKVSSVTRVTAAYIDSDSTINERTAALDVGSSSVTFGTQRQVTSSTAYAGGKLATCAYDGDRYCFASKADGTSIDYWISTNDTANNTWGSVNNVLTGTGLHLAQTLPVAGVGILIVYNNGTDVVVDWAVDGPSGGAAHPLEADVTGSGAAAVTRISLPRALTGAAAGTSAAAATRLNLPRALSADVAGSSSSAATRLSLMHALAGVAIGVSAADVTRLVLSHPLTADAAGIGEAAAFVLNVPHALASAADGLGVAEAIRLSLPHTLSADATGISDAAALRLFLAHALTGDAAGVSGANITLGGAAAELAASAIGSSSAAVNRITLAHALTAAAYGVSDAEAARITVGHILIAHAAGASAAEIIRIMLTHSLTAAALGGSDATALLSEEPVGQLLARIVISSYLQANIATLAQLVASMGVDPRVNALMSWEARLQAVERIEPRLTAALEID